MSRLERLIRRHLKHPIPPAAAAYCCGGGGHVWRCSARALDDLQLMYIVDTQTRERQLMLGHGQ